MQPITPTPRDPAPSRMRYRMQRWMLTPGIRRGLRVGIPLICIAAAAGSYFADRDRRDALLLQVTDLRDSFQDRPEFMVGLMAIDGAGTQLSEDIRTAVPLDFPLSSFDLDLEQIRTKIAALDPVKSASVRIRPGGVLQVDVIERQPVVIWRSRTGVATLDETGVHIYHVPGRKSHPNLPLIAGVGAQDHVSEALSLIAAAAPLKVRLRGLVRIGERRWDVVLTRDQRIMLPTDNPVPALERVIALSQAQDMLERDVIVVDLRNTNRATVRMNTEAANAMRRVSETGTDE